MALDKLLYPLNSIFLLEAAHHDILIILQDNLLTHNALCTITELLDSNASLWDKLCVVGQKLLL